MQDNQTLQKSLDESNETLHRKNIFFNQAYLANRKEQSKLFKQRPKVTNADAWQSIHNYGLAFDIVLLVDTDNNGTFETATWDVKKDFDKDLQADWMEITNYFKRKGWKWGGDFKSLYDAPHFEMTFGHTPKTLKALIDKKNVIIDNGITYPNI